MRKIASELSYIFRLVLSISVCSIIKRFMNAMKHIKKHAGIFISNFFLLNNSKILLDIIIFAPHNCHKSRKVEKKGMNIEIVALNETRTQRKK